VRSNDETLMSEPERPAQATLEFDAFYRAQYAKTVRLARLLTGSVAAAEDLAQETFLRVYRHTASLENPAGYLHTTTVNVSQLVSEPEPRGAAHGQAYAPTVVAIASSPRTRRGRG
jgi:hypothetical protein